MWKNVWKEIVYFFWPLKYRHKRIFIYLFVTIPTTLYIGVYLLFHCTEIRWEYEVDHNFWINFSGLLLGYALTVVVGFCIYLKNLQTILLSY